MLIVDSVSNGTYLYLTLAHKQCICVTVILDIYFYSQVRFLVGCNLQRGSDLPKVTGSESDRRSCQTGSPDP